MEIIEVFPGDPIAPRLIDYAANCSWDGGPGFAEYLEKGLYADYERAFAALDGETIAGYCNILREDCLPGLPYTPYIGFVFVDENYRGQRLSQKLITAAENRLRSLGFTEAYLTTDHDNLYEKYGYVYLDTYTAFWGAKEKLYRKAL